MKKRKELRQRLKLRTRVHLCVHVRACACVHVSAVHRQSSSPGERRHPGAPLETKRTGPGWLHMGPSPLFRGCFSAMHCLGAGRGVKKGPGNSGTKLSWLGEPSLHKMGSFNSHSDQNRGGPNRAIQWAFKEKALLKLTPAVPSDVHVQQGLSVLRAKN